MIRRTLFAIPLIVLSFVALPSSAQLLLFHANLNGTSEVPPNASPGTGSAFVAIDPTANTMRVQVSFQDLLGTTTASHIHGATAAPGVGNAMVATTVPTFPLFPLGVTSGFMDETFDMTLASSYNPAFITANGGTVPSAEAALFAGIEAGEAYLNIHTTRFPGGEIRGFLQAVPEPGPIALVGGIGVMAVYLCRRRK